MNTARGDQPFVTVRPMGNPLPLGFLGLFLATMLFAALQLGWLEPAQGRAVALAVIFFTVPVQLIASIFGLLARDSVAGTGMAVLAGTWATVAVLTLISPPGTTSAGLGTMLMAAAAALLVPAVSAWGTKLVPAAVLTVAALRFASTGAHELTGSTEWQITAGVVGLVLAALALYAALAFELEDSYRRVLLPLGRRMPLNAEREPGVRSQL